MFTENCWRRQIMYGDKYFECQNKFCMDMYNPAKFHDISIIFQDFMRGDVSSPQIIIPKKSPAQARKG